MTQESSQQGLKAVLNIILIRLNVDCSAKSKKGVRIKLNDFFKELKFSLRSQILGPGDLTKGRWPPCHLPSFSALSLHARVSLSWHPLLGFGTKEQTQEQNPGD